MQVPYLLATRGIKNKINVALANYNKYIVLFYFIFYYYYPRVFILYHSICFGTNLRYVYMYVYTRCTYVWKKTLCNYECVHFEEIF